MEQSNNNFFLPISVKNTNEILQFDGDELMIALFCFFLRFGQSQDVYAAAVAFTLQQP